MTGPAGEKWEVYTVLADSDTFGTSPQHSEGGTAENGVCCGATSESGRSAGCVLLLTNAQVRIQQAAVMWMMPRHNPSHPLTPGLRRILATLCLTQITSWGVLYYAFSVISARISERTGWSPPSVTAAFSAALVISALVGIPVGRWLDRHGPRTVMTAGAVLGPLALAGVALSPNLMCFR